MGANISQTPIACTCSTNLKDDNAEIVNLFECIRDERYNAKGYSSSMSLTYNPTLDGSPTKILEELVEYFTHQMLRSIEHVDAIQFDLLDFLWKNGRNYPIIFAIAKDLLIPPISTITLESTFNVDKQICLRLVVVSKNIF